MELTGRIDLEEPFRRHKVERGRFCQPSTGSPTECVHTRGGGGGAAPWASASSFENEFAKSFFGKRRRLKFRGDGRVSISAATSPSTRLAPFRFDSISGSTRYFNAMERRSPCNQTRWNAVSAAQRSADLSRRIPRVLIAASSWVNSDFPPNVRRPIGPHP